ncbi:hypothetical protein D621_11480 [beta proteobacterium AAP51]|nr:hypothetical protein D621_11480 [beta proteobacterium AAP51]
MIRLKMVKGSELAEGVRLEMQLPADAARFVIGRDPAAHWTIPDRTRAISARHCELLAAHGGLVLRDLSTNGTFVNGSTTRLAGEHALQDGDRIDLGPYTITVLSGLPRPAALPDRDARALPTAVPAAARPSSVEDTTPLGPQALPKPPTTPMPPIPLRGGDPAAMLGLAAPRRAGLTEILRAAPPLVDESLEVTKIRMAQKPAAASAAAPSPAPAPAAAPAIDPVLAQLAAGLGLPPQALAGRPAGPAAAQVAALARAAVLALRTVLAQQAQAQAQTQAQAHQHSGNHDGSAGPASAAATPPEAQPWLLAATPEAALQALLAPGADPGALLQRAAAQAAPAAATRGEGGAR